MKWLTLVMISWVFLGMLSGIKNIENKNGLCGSSDVQLLIIIWFGVCFILLIIFE